MGLTLSGALMGMGGGLWAQYNIAFVEAVFFFAITFSPPAMLVVEASAGLRRRRRGVRRNGRVRGHATHRERIDVPGITQIVVALVILLVRTAGRTA